MGNVFNNFYGSIVIEIVYEDIVDGFAISLHWLDALDETDGNEIKGLEDRVKRAEKLIIEARKPKGQASSHIEIAKQPIRRHVEILRYFAKKFYVRYSVTIFIKADTSSGNT